MYVMVTRVSNTVLCTYTFVNEVDLLLSVLTIIKSDISKKREEEELNR